MSLHHPVPDCGCRSIRRRAFLADMGMGFTGLALGAILSRDGIVRASEPANAWTPPDGRPHFAPKAKRVIWLFMRGGVSHLESFDPKPEIDKYAGKSIAETPYRETQNPDRLKANQRVVVVNDANGRQRSTLFPTQIGFRQCGQSGLPVSDFFPHLGARVDDLAIVRSMWTTDDNHGAQVQFHSGRHMLDGLFPTIGAWVNYGLGTLNENLPQFISIGSRRFERRDAHYLGPAYESVEMKVDPKNPLTFARPELELSAEEQRVEFDLLGRLNRLRGIEYPDDPMLAARIKSYELAFRMQTSIPGIVGFDGESAETKALYGLDQDATRPFGTQLLAARRFAEKGVRFIQIFHGEGAAGAWDAHSGLKANHEKLARQVDKPIAGLLQDLKQRGLLEDTLVVFATEFGRTPGAQGGNGRDHHIYGFSVWMAGGGLKGGIAHGATDEIGFHAVENRHYVTDIHATILHLLGLHPRRLEVPGRKRLEIDYGKVIPEILV
ncbi:MAG: DUF1501 domain-containing protein [Verrucomicrobiota bacterium]|nr:DUF1501 domain-containing protein [Verrucomicrobiota bacterium]